MCIRDRDKTLDISAVSFHKMIQSAKKLNAIADYGSIVALSYVAAQRTFYEMCIRDRCRLRMMGLK